MTYSNILSHRSMILDDYRNSLYADSIKKLVHPESVVLDLGAGLGIHGLVAANAGAKKVYLVEPGAGLEVAAKVIARNNSSDRIICVRGNIEEVKLPEPVDIIISVFTGNFLLQEDLLPSLFYARDKYLRKGGTLVPDRAKMEVAPVTTKGLFEKNIASWSSPSQGIDYGLVREYAANSIYYGDHRDEIDDYLAEPTGIIELDFMTAKKADCRNTIEVKITKDGTCHGWLGWFQTRLGDTWLSTSPQVTRTHWGQAFLPLDPPLQMAAGDTISFQLHRPELGEWTWIVKTGNTEQKHSTFLSHPITPGVLQMKSAEHKAVLNMKGQAALFVLQNLNGSITSNEIATELVKSFPEIFPDHEHAMRFVINLIERFTRT